MKLSIRSKLTLWYIGTVVALLVVFVSADVVGLRSNLLSYANERLSAESLLDAWKHALWEHGLLMIVLIALVSVVGTFFIRRVFRPVKLLVETAKSITSRDLSLRVDDPGDRDEIGDLARTLNDMIARIESGFHQVQRFSGDASHELKTPLTVMKGELEVALRKDREASEYRAVLEHLLDEVDRLSGIVDDLMFLSRVDAKSIGKSTEQVALDRIVLEVFENASKAAEDGDVSLRLERVDESAVRGDASMFARLVANLVDNAIKFTAGGGTVTLALANHGQASTLSIEDTGCGIDEREIPLIFDRFYRADSSRSRKTGGVGLGLSIVREIADLYDLDVRLRSPGQKGSTATVTWETKGRKEA